MNIPIKYFTVKVHHLVRFTNPLVIKRKTGDTLYRMPSHLKGIINGLVQTFIGFDISAKALQTTAVHVHLL